MDLLASLFSDLGDSTRPAGLAVDWILNSDTALPDPCLDPDTVVQRFILATLYYSTLGEEWLRNDRWLAEEDVCVWFGVGCDGDNNIVELNMSELGRNWLLYYYMHGYDSSLCAHPPHLSAATLMVLHTHIVSYANSLEQPVRRTSLRTQGPERDALPLDVPELSLGRPVRRDRESGESSSS